MTTTSNRELFLLGFREGFENGLTWSNPSHYDRLILGDIAKEPYDLDFEIGYPMGVTRAHFDELEVLRKEKRGSFFSMLRDLLEPRPALAPSHSCQWETDRWKCKACGIDQIEARGMRAKPMEVLEWVEWEIRVTEMFLEEGIEVELL